MDSLYEVVQSSGDGPPPPIPSRSCSPAVLLDDSNKWRGSPRSVSVVRFSQYSVFKCIKNQSMSACVYNTDCEWLAGMSRLHGVSA